MIRRLALLCLVLCVPLAARASTSSCSGVGDGTACTTECISAGVCHSNVCVATTVSPNGSACSSENKCTIDDTCQNGQCVAGGAISCPSIDTCNRGECVPNVGCVIVNECRVDLAVPVDLASTPDLSTSDMALGDMSASFDASVPQDMISMPIRFDLAQSPHDLASIVTDACFMPPGAEFLLCPGADGPVEVPVDLAGADLARHGDGGTGDMAERYGHIRGSRAGDCDTAPGSHAASPLVLGLVACALLVLRRRAA